MPRADTVTGDLTADQRLWHELGEISGGIKVIQADRKELFERLLKTETTGCAKGTELENRLNRMDKKTVVRKKKDSNGSNGRWGFSLFRGLFAVEGDRIRDAGRVTSLALLACAVFLLGVILYKVVEMHRARMAFYGPPIMVAEAEPEE